MTKQIKRPISMLLAILMIVGMLTVIPITSASAATQVTRYVLLDYNTSGDVHALFTDGEYLLVNANVATDTAYAMKINAAGTGVESSVVKVTAGDDYSRAYVDAADNNFDTGIVWTAAERGEGLDGVIGRSLKNGTTYLESSNSAFVFLNSPNTDRHWELSNGDRLRFRMDGTSGSPTKLGYLYCNSNGEYYTSTTSSNNDAVYLYKKETVDVPESYTVTTNPGAHGSITADATVFEGSDLTFTVTPDSGFEVATVTVNDTAVTLDANNQYTVTNVQSDITIAATFQQKTTLDDRYKLVSGFTSGKDYLIVSSNAAGSRYAVKNNSGSLASAGVTVSNGDYVYIDNDDSTIVWTASTHGNGFYLTNSNAYLQMTTSGQSTSRTYTPGTTTTAPGNSNYWSYTNTNHLTYAISTTRTGATYFNNNNALVGAASNGTGVGSVYLYEKVPTHTLTATAGTGGSVDVAKATVYDGDSFTFTFTPDEGYVVDQVTVGTSHPSLTADGEYTFSNVTADQSISVTFKRVYTITWLNDDGSEIDTTTVDAGVVPTHADATKAADEDYTYTFTGWDPAPAAATADATYTAQFDAEPNYTADYYIIGTMTDWKVDPAYALTENASNPGEYVFSELALLATDQFKVVYAEPGKEKAWYPSDSGNYGENGEITAAGNYDVYFKPGTGGDDWFYHCLYVTPTKYTITWKNDDGSVIDTTEVAYGTVPTHAVASKEADAQYTYTFAGWTPTVVAVTGDAEYTATFDSTVNEYTITWLNDDDSVIDTTTVAYGTVPTHADATKDPTASVVYTFNGWDTTPVAVTGEATYKATYTESARTYTITFVNYDDEELQSGDVEYGQLPVYTGDDPVKPEDHDNTYTFAGWDPEVVAVTGEATYKATFTPHEIQYWTISDATTDTNGSVTINAEGNEVRDGGEFTFTVTPNNGYEVKKVTVNNAEVTPVNGVYTVSNVTEDQEIVATFKTVSYIYLRVDTLDTDSEYLLVETAAEGKGHAVWNNNGTIGAKEVDILTNNLGSYILSAGADIIWTTGATTTSFMNNSHNASTDTPYLRIQSTGAVIFYDQDHAWNYDSSTHKLTYHKTSDDPVLYYKDANTGFIGTGSGTNTVTTANATDAMVMYLYKKVYIGTVTFKNDSGNVLDSAVYENGTVPTHDAPTKDATDKFTYTFAGWNDGENTYAPGEALPAVDGDATYTAVFTETINKYAIKFVDYDGTELQSSEVEYGETPVFSEDDPTRAENVDYTYTFSGWDKPIASVTGAETYTAVYEPTAKFAEGYYIVGTMNNWTIDADYKLDENTAAQGEYMLPEVAFTNGDAFKVIYAKPNEANPGGTRLWYPDGTDNDYAVGTAGNYDVYFRPDGQGGEGWHYGVIYTTPTKYTITWKNDDGSVIDTTTVAYGTVPTHADPTKEATAQYTYTFTGWDTDPVAVTGAAEYTATFSSTVNEYTITWKNDDGNVIDTTTVAYGTVPTHADPTKEATAQYTYTFAGWTPEVVAVTGDAEYTATYTETVNEYTITWKNDDGNVIDTTTVAYGTVPTHADAAKQATAQYTYTFAGWTPEVVAVTGDAEYTATYTETINEYTITWKNDDGNVIDTTTVAYGTVPIHADPTKEGHAFSGWTPEVVAVTGEATYTATFYADEVGAKLAGHTISLQGDIGVNFYMELADSVLADEEAYMLFEIPTAEGPVAQEILVKDAAKEKIGDKWYYKFKCEVAAKEMTSQISAQIISDGKQSTTYYYSVQDYAKYLLENADENGTDLQKAYAEAAPLVKAMLNYGAAAQIYFDTNTENLANDILVDVDKVVTDVTYNMIDKPYSSASTSMPEGVQVTEVSLSLKAETTLTLFFKSTRDLTFTCTNKDGTITYDVKTEHVGVSWAARIRGINAKDLGEDLVLTVTADGTDAGSITYCPMTYCRNILRKGSSDQNLPAVIKALYWYWQAALNYFD